jgi:RNA recognition motif-containing protein
VQVGNVLYCTIIKDQSGRSKGCGIVEFDDPADAFRAMAQLNGYVLDGFNIQVGGC